MKLTKTIAFCFLILLAVPAIAQNLSDQFPLGRNEPLIATPLPPSLMDQVTNQHALENSLIPVRTSPQQQPHITWQSFCANLSEHIPRRDVAYQEGVDVYGNTVAAAHLPSHNKLNLPLQYPVLITVDQARSLGVPVPYQADSFVGTAYISVDGSVTFNGQPLQNQNVQQMCGFMAR
jgi:hypothetical protein